MWSSGRHFLSYSWIIGHTRFAATSQYSVHDWRSTPIPRHQWHQWIQANYTSTLIFPIVFSFSNGAAGGGGAGGWTAPHANVRISTLLIICLVFHKKWATTAGWTQQCPAFPRPCLPGVALRPEQINVQGYVNSERHDIQRHPVWARILYLVWQQTCIITGCFFF